MPPPLLASKLYVPPARARIVHRARLTARLDDGIGRHQFAGRRLTLISAAAGFGKTTLISEWAARSAWPVAWLSLDEGDNDRVQFLAYLIAALQTVIPHVGEGALAALQSPQPPPPVILAAVLNEVGALSDPFVLVLDDYHAIDAKPVDEAMAFLLQHMPAQMHLIIATREDPQLPLARLRARDRLTELRAADLRFTAAEAAQFLNHVMDLNLSPAEVATLEMRTEGWIAGLHLAALSMQGRAENAAFIETFGGRMTARPDQHFCVYTPPSVPRILLVQCANGTTVQKSSMRRESMTNQVEQEAPKTRSGSGGADAVYGIGLIGAWVFYFKRATTTQQRVQAFFKGFAWPAFLVYELLAFLESE